VVDQRRRARALEQQLLKDLEFHGIVQIRIPSLSERLGDISLLVPRPF
jgi:transcriptional regulator with AAA-type ATPase domain